MMCCSGICIVQIQPRKDVTDHAGCMAPTPQRELDRTDHTAQGCVCPERSRSSGNGLHIPSVQGVEASQTRVSTILFGLTGEASFKLLPVCKKKHPGKKTKNRRKTRKDCLSGNAYE